MAEVKTTEEYDGTNWSAAGTATSVGGEFAALGGVQTDAFAVGGYTGSYHGNSENHITELLGRLKQLFHLL